MAVHDQLPRDLPPEVRQTLNAYVAEVAKLFGPTMEALLLYGSAASGEFLPGRSNLNLLILLNKRDLDLLRQYAKTHKRWSKEGIVVPLFLTVEELETSAGLFPLEVLEIKEHHLLLAGRDPLPGLQPDVRRLPAQCEQEIRGNLYRLRQRFVEGGGTQEAVLLLLPLSLTALLPCLRGLIRALPGGGAPPRSTDAMLDVLPATLGLDPAVFQEVLKLKRGIISPGPVEVPRLLERYLDALDALLQQVGRLKAEGKL